MKNPMKTLPVWILVLIAPLAMAAAPLPSNSAKAPDLKGYKVIGYVPSWRGDLKSIQYDKLTHINYAFLEVGADASLNPLDLAQLRSVVDQAHAHGVKVLISVGGGSNSAVLGPVIVNATTRKTLIGNLEAFVAANQLDGADIDWEYPQKASDSQPYTELMTTLAKDLHAKGKLLTTATVGAAWAGDAISAEVLQALDFMNIMAYDVPGEQHSSYATAVTQLNYWLGRGLPKAKAVLGVPFYGYPSKGGRDTSASYRELVAANPAAAQSDTSDYQGGVSYNGIPTMRQKAQLAMQSGAGLMIWELTFDAPSSASLLSAIHETLTEPAQKPAPGHPQN